MLGFLFFITRGGETDPESGARYCCGQCHALLAEARDLVGVLERPPRRIYTNPHGLECDLVTFGQAEASNLVASPFATTEHTWFAGYAWRPLGCAGCGAHVGWRFEAEPGTSSPSVFFGLLMDRMEIE